MPSPVTVTIEGQESGRPNEREDYGKQLEVLVSYLYHKLIPPGSIVVDGGANGGMHCFPMARLVGEAGHVHAFEPIPDLAKRLRERAFKTGMAPRLTIYDMALGERAGRAQFMVDDGNFALSHLAYLDGVKWRNREAHERMIECEVVTLDSILAGKDIPFIKLDLEGFDFLALRGAQQLLASSRPVVIFENGRSVAARAYGYSADQFFGFFAELGYEISDVHNRRLSRETWDNGQLGWEFVAGPAGHANLARARDLIHSFWAGLASRPVIADWQACSRIVANPVPYVE